MAQAYFLPVYVLVSLHAPVQEPSLSIPEQIRHWTLIGTSAGLWSLCEPAFALLLLGQFEMGVCQDANEGAEDAQTLV